LAIALLGFIVALGSRCFTVSLVGFEDYFDKKIGIPDWLKPALGGLALGIFALLFTILFGVTGKRILGVGYETINLALQGELPVRLLLLFLFAKFLATCLTLGSGGSGGIFAPALFMGAMLGGTFGTILHGIFPNTTAPPGLYAVVGMGAFFAGAAHAPITAIMILFEMTGYRYTILLPIMTCSVVSTLVASLISRDNIYTVKLCRDGIIPKGGKPNPLKAMLAGDVMLRDPQYVMENMAIATLAELVGTKLHTSLPVINSRGDLVGLLTYKEIHHALRKSRDTDGLTVKDFMNREPMIVFSDESCDTVFHRMKDANQGIAPVVKRKHPNRMVGVMTYRHIYDAYQKATMH
ncbi:MAG: chloride channel protein, partial [bacterium]